MQILVISPHKLVKTVFFLSNLVFEFLENLILPSAGNFYFLHFKNELFDALKRQMQPLLEIPKNLSF